MGTQRQMYDVTVALELIARWCCPVGRLTRGSVHLGARGAVWEGELQHCICAVAPRVGATERTCSCKCGSGSGDIGALGGLQTCSAVAGKLVAAIGPQEGAG
jgi:hypothetical protein